MQMKNLDCRKLLTNNGRINSSSVGEAEVKDIKLHRVIKEQSWKNQWGLSSSFKIQELGDILL